MLRGGESDSASVVPHDPTESPLIEAIRWDGLEMPPKENDRLDEQQIAAIERWVRDGAPWPSSERQDRIREQARREPVTAEGVLVSTSGGLADDWTYRRYKPEDIWAYQPINPPEIETSGQNPIDILIERRLSTVGIEPAAVAGPVALIRRVTFDVTGLPPTPAEVQSFVDATSVDADAAWESLVDRLLESPHYGEQAARHWLDVVRYADSSGFANDWERPNAWRYRDYVIRSFNDDKPYDQFVVEQIAGDELKPGDPEMQIAVGFLRMGPWEHSVMSVAKETRQQYLDDVTDAVGQVFLAHPLQCASCHDHKFDPVPTRDYYAMQAVFANTQVADADTAWLSTENLDYQNQDRQLHERKKAWNKEVIAAINKTQAEEYAKWFAERGLPYKTRKEALKAKAPPDQVPGVRTGLTPDELGKQRVSRKWGKRYDWESFRYQPVALSVYNGKTNLPSGYNKRFGVPEDPLAEGEFAKSTILTGGDPYSPGEAVSPGVLSAVPGADQVRVPQTVGGRRLALARWIADPKNPLTPRVIVNRLWQTHFGRGLAGTPNNFGAMGKKPTHPELLDHLADLFVQEGWSAKRIHRLILTSKAYRRSTRHPHRERLSKVDPNSNLYAVFLPRRLAAEEMRDAMLALSGELNTALGGIPARPDMNLEAALQPRMIMGSFAPAYTPNPLPEQRNRRTIYALKLRGQRDPFLEVFNQPTPDISCELRDNSNTTPQVFSLLNGQETAERSLALAKRVLDEATDEADAVTRLFWLAYSRPPSADELRSAIAHWHLMEEIQAQAKHEPIQYPRSISREANEENSGQPFKLVERLFEYDEYVPDLEPHAVDARTRALADVCLAVLNSSEFVYVY